MAKLYDSTWTMKNKVRFLLMTKDFKARKVEKERKKLYHWSYKASDLE